MTYKGHVENGTVVLDDPISLPDGAKVKVLLSEQKEESGNDLHQTREKLMAFCGIFNDLPEDASTNIEHYLYGHPKQ